jgi:hypothetical protein
MSPHFSPENFRERMELTAAALDRLWPDRKTGQPAAPPDAESES